ncbi:MAG: ferrous iron transport protein B [Acutalibacteraceae bacterium]
MSILKKSSKFKIKNQKSQSKNLSTYNLAIAGNPNVGKSTVFNTLTGLNQHTGNWPGKTVECAKGKYEYNGTKFYITDLPGTYSLTANSPEEEIARDFICFENPDAVIITLDATCVERNLNLALQILEVTKKAIVCVNLIDEAKRKKIHIDLDELSLQLGVPVVATNARLGHGIEELKKIVQEVCEKKIKTFQIKNQYPENLSKAVEKLKENIPVKSFKNIDKSWISLKLLENSQSISQSIEKYLHEDIFESKSFKKIFKLCQKELRFKKSFSISNEISKTLILRAEKIYKLCVKIENNNYDHKDRLTDKILTSKITGFPIMILMLLGIFWITIVGANYPSEIIASGLFWLQNKLIDFFYYINSPAWLSEMLVMGVYRTLAWVISVMLPPMAIFFPLFTFLEDVGYLPRVAFNLDNIFKKCGAHGKQSLTMCMGFGCNACGVIGCKIIDSPRERLIAILTNNFVPCNGRFPLLISIITMFFIGNGITLLNSAISTTILTCVIIFGILITLLISKILSATLLKGMQSSFILELPPYRQPQIGKILVRSLFDRTIFVLGRAVMVAAPAGVLIWVMANIKINNLSILTYASDFLDPFGKLIGMDGTILIAFILGFPANEIVFPIIIMGYLCGNSLMELENSLQLHSLLVAHGWTYITAISVMLFSLMHFPCGTTCFTIKKETGSIKWTVLSFLIPTITGIVTCFIVSNTLNYINRLIQIC